MPLLLRDSHLGLLYGMIQLGDCYSVGFDRSGYAIRMVVDRWMGMSVVRVGAKTGEVTKPEDSRAITSRV